ncbi:MAG: uroporphyrinogen decarboxylase family protein [Christensenellales bacterium]|jgi:uroporphyrinogen decarboxylase
MSRNMYKWFEEIIASPIKKALPILSFPCVQLMDISVTELISSSELQSKGLQKVAERVDTMASVSFMDLSVEAECFGSTIRYSEEEVPTVIGSVVSTMEEAEALKIPETGAGRTQLYIDAIGDAVQHITDRPVFAGVIGPYSLAARLMDVTEIMIYSYEEPELVHLILDKVTSFLAEYCLAYKKMGANGVMMAEPVAGLLSPSFIQEFSSDYVRKIVEKVQDENFPIIYHNCGNTILKGVDEILKCGAHAFHFGNAVDMEEMMARVPSDVVAMGNVDPAGVMRHGTAELVYQTTTDVLERCSKYPNFAISSGCDIPPMTSWENIDAFFKAVDDFYSKK